MYPLRLSIVIYHVDMNEISTYFVDSLLVLSNRKVECIKEGILSIAKESVGGERLISKTEFLTRVMKLEELLQRLEETIDATIVEEVLWYYDAVVESEEKDLKTYSITR